VGVEKNNTRDEKDSSPSQGEGKTLREREAQRRKKLLVVAARSLKGKSVLSYQRKKKDRGEVWKD